MNEKTKEIARMHMAQIAAKKTPTRRLPIDLPESRDRVEAYLLGLYGAAVESRDRHFEMDDATVSKVERVVKWLYDSRKRGLLLCGTLGNGKTTMLLALCRFFGVNASYLEAQAVFNYYKSNQSLPYIPSKAVLLIDDLGVEPPSYNNFGEVVFPLGELLMQRYNMNQPTIIATNCTVEQLGEIYGDRLMDRIREMYAMIPYTEPSYRLFR